MALRTGPQGVTNADVARRAGVNYAPAGLDNSSPPVNYDALIQYILGPQAPGYGQKYGGYPTAEYAKQAVLGQAFGMSDLAQQAAQYAQSNASDVYKKYAPQVKEVTNYANNLNDSRLSRGRMLEEVGSSPALRSAERAATRSDLTNQFANETAPSRNLADAFGAYTTSDFARQIAEKRYGYDPMLAAGLFGQDVNLSYDSQQQALADMQMRSQYPTFGMTQDEILANTMTPEEYSQYQYDKAYSSYNNVYDDTMFTELDNELIQAYGVDPSSITVYPTETVREAMQSPDFLTLVQTSLQNMKTYADADVGLTGTEIASKAAQDYNDQNPGQIVRAKILYEILKQLSFSV